MDGSDQAASTGSADAKDYSELLLLVRKGLATYEAAALLNQWGAAAAAVYEAKPHYTALCLFAARHDKTRSDRG